MCCLCYAARSFRQCESVVFDWMYRLHFIFGITAFFHFVFTFSCSSFQLQMEKMCNNMPNSVIVVAVVIQRSTRRLKMKKKKRKRMSSLLLEANADIDVNEKKGAAESLKDLK